jgi:hypothetical protein
MSSRVVPLHDISSPHPYPGFVKPVSFFSLQMADNGPPHFCQFWRDLTLIGALANGKGAGEAKDG